MHARARSQQKPKSSKFSTFSKDYTQNISTLSSLESTEGIIGENSFIAALDGLTEKSAGVREKSYLHTAGLLQSYSIPLWSLESNELTLCEAVKKSFKNSLNEQGLASRTIALYAISLGTDCETLLNTIKPSLQASLLREKKDSGLVKAEMTRAWATICFIAADTNETLEFIDNCIGWLNNASSLWQKGILQSISLCCSALPPSIVNNTIIPKYGKSIAKFIEPAADQGVRISAAQCICLFYDFYIEANDIDIKQYDCYALDGFIDVTQVLDDLQEYSMQNKSEKKSISILFNAFYQCIEEGFCPFTEVITISHSTMNYSDWCSIIQLEWFRDYLQGGFLAHLTGNELLHQIFNVDPSLFVSRVKISREEKREYKSKNSAASKERSKDRRKNQRKGIHQDEL